MSPFEHGSPGGRPDYVYIASSWRNPLHTAVVAGCRAAGIDCYDFRADEGAGFHWSEAGVSEHPTQGEYLAGLQHPRAEEGFASDMAAMEAADTFVLVLPCGRSSHLELGWAVGEGKRTAILLDGTLGEPVVPELMYKMVDYLAPSFFDLLGWLGVED